MIYAHFFTATKRKSAGLILSTGPELNKGILETIDVSGKREANAIARQRGAKPWNF